MSKIDRSIVFPCKDTRSLEEIAPSFSRESKKKKKVDSKTKEEEENKAAERNPGFVEVSSKEKCCLHCGAIVLSKGSKCSSCGEFEE